MAHQKASQKDKEKVLVQTRIPAKVLKKIDKKLAKTGDTMAGYLRRLILQDNL